MIVMIRSSSEQISQPDVLIGNNAKALSEAVSVSHGQALAVLGKGALEEWARARPDGSPSAGGRGPA